MSKSTLLISLGINCEASFQIQRRYLALDSFIFSWAWIPNEKCLISAIRNPDSIGSEGFKINYDTGDMCICNRTGMKFHGRKKISTLKDESEIKDFLREVSERTDYLKKKFSQAIQSESKKIFIFKRPEKILTNLTDFSEELRLALLFAGAKNFEMVIISHKKYHEPVLNIPGVYNHYLDRYSPFNNVSDACVVSWDRIFDELEFGNPLTKNLIS